MFCQGEYRAHISHMGNALFALPGWFTGSASFSDEISVRSL